MQVDLARRVARQLSEIGFQLREGTVDVHSGVRRVVDQVCADLPAVAHVEIDMDADPDAARRLSVLSLPTTIIFDADGRPRYRTSGVPTAADLRSALEPLLA